MNNYVINYITIQIVKIKTKDFIHTFKDTVMSSEEVLNFVKDEVIFSFYSTVLEASSMCCYVIHVTRELMLSV